MLRASNQKPFVSVQRGESKAGPSRLSLSIRTSHKVLLESSLLLQAYQRCCPPLSSAMTLGAVKKQYIQNLMTASQAPQHKCLLGNSLLN